ncbi:histone-lysine N-methyltransferase SETMAR [Trichonephila clavipes]|nr:histone-lysine N-methyltransferase SETMAR [Trichonephila clavipes]
MEVNKEKIRFILQFFFDKGENSSQVAENENGLYGCDTVTANYVQFWFRRFRSGICYVKDTPYTSRPVVENVDKITEKIEVDRHVSSRSIAQELKIYQKTVLNHLRKVGFKKKLDSRPGVVSMDEVGRRGFNVSDQWGGRRVGGNDRGQSAAQTRTNGQEGSTVYLVRLERNNLLGFASPGPNTKFRYLLSTTGPFEASD